MQGSSSNRSNVCRNKDPKTSKTAFQLQIPPTQSASQAFFGQSRIDKDVRRYSRTFFDTLPIFAQDKLKHRTTTDYIDSKHRVSFGADQVFNYTVETPQKSTRKQASEQSFVETERKGQSIQTSAKENRQPISRLSNAHNHRVTHPLEDERSQPHTPRMTLIMASPLRVGSSTAESTPSRPHMSAAHRHVTEATLLQPPVVAPRRRLPAAGLFVTF